MKLNYARLEGNIRIKCTIIGTLKNDTIKVDWFDYSDKVLADVFNLSENKVVCFEEGSHLYVDYLFFIPSCKLIGNNSTISINNIKDHSPISDYIKIRNKHYDGGGVDSFTIQGLKFETDQDGTFLFSISNARNIKIEDSSFYCYGRSTLCMHALDIRGNVHNAVISNCDFVNMSGSRTGGGIWLRSFGGISDISILNVGLRIIQQMKSLR